MNVRGKLGDELGHTIERVLGAEFVEIINEIRSASGALHDPNFR
jgi:hypothetical protein